MREDENIPFLCLPMTFDMDKRCVHNTSDATILNNEMPMNEDPTLPFLSLYTHITSDATILNNDVDNERRANYTLSVSNNDF